MLTDHFPATKPEALKMLNRAFWHLRNRGVVETFKARVIINDVQNLLLDEMYRGAA